jgi:arylesterase / paraoxonase
MAMSWRTLWRLAVAGLVLAALLSGFLILRLKARLGDFTKVEPHFTGSCRAIPALVGVEDMAIDRRARRVWAASQDRTSNKRGAIYLMPLDGFEDASIRVDVTLGKPAAFSPLGISLWTGPDGRQVLYAVNRPVSGVTRIEIYDVDKSGLLAHRSTIKAPKYARINDVAGAGPDVFYASAESVYREGTPLAKLTQLLADHSGGVIFWKGGKFKRVADDLQFASGVALTPDGGVLYAASMLGKELRIYDRDVRSNKLSLRERVSLSSAPDNIDVAPDGGVWIAAQPKLGALGVYAQAPKARTAPSQVLLLERDPSGQGGDLHQVYLSNDGALSGATIAVADGDRMIMGGVFAPNALACVLPQDFRQTVQHRFVGVR